MAKRADAHFLKTVAKLGKYGKNIVKKLAATPLIILNEDTEIGRTARVNGEVIAYDIKNFNLELPEIPVSPFTVMLQEKEDEYGDEAIHFLIQMKNIDDEEIKTLFEVSVLNIHLLSVRYRIYVNRAGNIHSEIWNMKNGKPINSLRTDEVYNLSGDKVHFDVIEKMSLGILGRLIAFFQEIEESDLHAVESKGITHKTHMARKPWQRTDLSTIVFLNQLPRDKKEHQGGTHQSPVYHQRRASKRRLMHEKYKDNPNYGKTINVKSCWVGERETKVNGVTYTVL